MFSNITQGFKKTRDARIKFNVIFGTFFMLFFVVSLTMYSLNQIFVKLFNFGFLGKDFYFVSIPLLIIVLTYYSFQFYYWYFQRDIIEKAFSKKEFETISDFYEDFNDKLFFSEKVYFLSFIIIEPLKLFTIILILHQSLSSSFSYEISFLIFLSAIGLFFWKLKISITHANINEFFTIQRNGIIKKEETSIETKKDVE